MQTSVRQSAPSRPRGGRAAAIVVAVIATGVTLTACSGGGSGAGAGAGSGAASGSATGTAPSAPGAGTPSAGASSGTGGSVGAGSGTGVDQAATTGGSAAAGPGHCTTAQLRYGLLRAHGAAGTIFVAVRVTNAGPRACWTYGYPGLQILDQAGHRVPTTVLRGTAARVQGPLSAALLDHPKRVDLAPMAWGWFSVGYSDVTDSTLCPKGPVTGTRLAVIAPDTTTPATLALNTAACGGRLGVSPVLAASTLPG